MKIIKKSDHWIIKLNDKTFNIKVSRRKSKKYDLFENDKYILSFGASDYPQYFDKLGYYKDFNHNNDKRRENYYKRFGPSNDIYSAKYWSHNVLW